jgi:hypothetical protein
MIGMWRHQKKEDAKAFESSNENRFVRRVIVLMPLIVLASCLLAMVKPRLGVLVWVVFLVIGSIAKGREK